LNKKLRNSQAKVADTKQSVINKLAKSISFKREIVVNTIITKNLEPTIGEFRRNEMSSHAIDPYIYEISLNNLYAIW